MIGLYLFFAVTAASSFIYSYMMVRRILTREDQILKGISLMIDTLRLQREDQAAMMMLAETLRGYKDAIEYRRAEPPSRSLPRQDR